MNEGKKDRLIEATIELISEEGLASFSMKKAVLRAKTSETLIYQHFETKENLFYHCFKKVNKEIEAVMTSFQWPVVSDKEEMLEIIHKNWLKYFQFLIKNDYRTLFYLMYRNSSYIHQVDVEEKEKAYSFFNEFSQVYQAMDQNFHIGARVEMKCFWTYLMDLSASFAIRIIRGDLPDDQATYDSIWNMLYGSISGLMEEK